MAGKKLTVVISQAQGKNPSKRHLEEEIAAALIMDPEIDVSIIPHLYDLTADHTGMLFLKSVPGDMLVLSWLYPRAARWIMARNGVKGQEGQTLLRAVEDEDEEDAPPEVADRPNAVGPGEVPKRKIYCLDLRAQSSPDVYLEEIRRIAREGAVQTVDLLSWIKGNPRADQLERYLQKPKPTVPANGNGHAAAILSDRTSAPQAVAPANGNGNGSGNGNGLAEEPVKRRWYPVIDYSRCTNCMECIDFCLFGVYGVDNLDQILVEQQDNCKKGCPACSRVCPENAIIFPEHKTPAIAGGDVGTVSGLKIDLSKLFGAPSAIEVAVMERDTELVADGRDAVGMEVGIPKRQAHKPQTHDALDDLMDGLDSLEL